MSADATRHRWKTTWNNIHRDHLCGDKKSRMTIKPSASQLTKEVTKPDLPISGHKQAIIESVLSNDVTIISSETGSGKSTLAQLMLRMYDVGEGQILYDDQNIRRILLSNLRSQISYVPQDVFLFSDTVRNNIRFGKANATDAEVDEAARKASIYNEIAVFADGMDTMVGERGVTLSGGQKQRISIARALIKDPNIVIFDDCLSAVDARTEQTIIANLYEYLQNKTAVIITHRIFALFNFDKIIVMQDGAIAEQGTHQQLLAQNGIYAEMFMRQQQNDGPSGEAPLTQ